MPFFPPATTLIIAYIRNYIEPKDGWRYKTIIVWKLLQLTAHMHSTGKYEPEYLTWIPNHEYVIYMVPSGMKKKSGVNNITIIY
jgi:hypothetical protein